MIQGFTFLFTIDGANKEVLDLPLSITLPNDRAKNEVAVPPIQSGGPETNEQQGLFSYIRSGISYCSSGLGSYLFRNNPPKDENITKVAKEALAQQFQECLTHEEAPHPVEEDITEEEVAELLSEIERKAAGNEAASGGEERAGEGAEEELGGEGKEEEQLIFKDFPEVANPQSNDIEDITEEQVAELRSEIEQKAAGDEGASGGEERAGEGAEEELGGEGAEEEQLIFTDFPEYNIKPSLFSKIEKMTPEEVEAYKFEIDYIEKEERLIAEIGREEFDKIVCSEAADKHGIEYFPDPHPSQLERVKQIRRDVVARLIDGKGEPSTAAKIVTATLNTAIHIADYIVLGGEEFSSEEARLRREIADVTGDDTVADVLEQLLDEGREGVRSKIAKWAGPLADREKKLNYEKVSGYASRLAKLYTLKMAASLTKKIGKGFEGDYSTEMVKLLIREAYSTFDAIDGGEYEKALELKDPKERSRALLRLFKPSSEQLMKLLFPEGEEELFLGQKGALSGMISSWVWSYFSGYEMRENIGEYQLPGLLGGYKLSELPGNSWLPEVVGGMIPELLASIYGLTHAPKHHSESDYVDLQSPDGKPLHAFALFCTEKARELIPKALEKSGEELGLSAVEELKDIEELSGDEENSLKLAGFIKEWIIDLCKSQSPEMERVRDSMRENIYSYLLHIFAKLSEGKSPNKVVNFGKNGLSLFNDFFTDEKHRELKIAFKEASPNGEKGPGSRTRRADRMLKEQFQGLAEAIIDSTDLGGDPIIDIVKRHVLPALLRDFYEKAYLEKEDTADCAAALTKQFLGELIGDRESPPEEAISSPDYAAPEEAGRAEEPSEIEFPSNEIAPLLSESRKEEIDKLRNSFDTFFGNGAELLIDLIKKYVKSDSHRIAEIISDGPLRKSQLSQEEIALFGEAIGELLSSKEESVENMWSLTETLTKTALYKLFTKIIQSAIANCEGDLPEEVNRKLPQLIFTSINQILADNLPAIDAAHRALESETSLTREEKEKKISEIYSPLVKKFTALAGEEWETLLPMPAPVQKAIKKLLEESILPSLFHSYYGDLNTIRFSEKSFEEELEETLGSSNSTQAIGRVEEYINKLIPGLLDSHAEKIATLIDSTCDKLFAHLSEEQRDALKGLLAENLHAISGDSPIKESSKAASLYLKGILSKMLANFAKKSENFDLVGFGTMTLFDTAKQIRRIDKIAKSEKKPAHLLSDEILYKGFMEGIGTDSENLLHPALRKEFDPTLSDEEKEKHQLDNFFRPLAKRILRYTGMNDPAAFPIPSPLRDTIYPLIEREILPRILKTIVDEMLKPETINKLLLALFKKLNPAIDELADSSETDSKSYDDPAQVEINRAIGEVIKGVLELVPDFFTSTIYKSEKIQKMAPEAIGYYVREYLEKNSLNILLDKALASLEFEDPEVARNRSDAENSEINREVEEELKKEMTEYTSKQAKEKIRSYFQSNWDEFQKKFDALVEENLGEVGVEIKKFLDKVFAFIVFDILGTIFSWLIVKPVWFFVELFIEKKMGEIKDHGHIKMFNRNLLYCEMDRLFAALEGDEKFKHDAVDKAIVEEIEEKRREKEAEMERIAAENREKERIAEEERAAQEKMSMQNQIDTILEKLRQQIRA